MMMTSPARAASRDTVSPEHQPLLSSANTASAGRDIDSAFERHRRELHVHCYRMLGSFTDAEDLVQETFFKAWRHRDDLQPGGNIRAWLYRIATNACIDFVRGRQRRAVAPVTGADVPWLQPYPDVLLDRVATDDDTPETAAVGRETIELAFIAAIQGLPARQRAVFVLNATLGWSPADVATALDMTHTAVNSSLQRARATLRSRLPRDRSEWSCTGLSDDERDTLRRFIEIHERGDAEAASAMMRADIVATMPPNPQVFRGRAAMAPLLDMAFGPNGMGKWMLLATPANRQPAAASYLCRPGDKLFRAFKLDVLRVVDGQVAENTTFDARLFPAFGLPEAWPAGAARASSEPSDRSR
jgi:RNA polymerase sigma-70 factor (TIGR02960 family)